MSFVCEKCTEEIFREIGFPESLRARRETDPLGRTIAISTRERAGLFALPDHFAIYPDREFRLCIEGRCLNVWETSGERGQSNTSIEVYVSQATEDFDDERLKCIAQEAFTALYGAEITRQRIRIKGRRPPPKPPRPPEKVMEGLNKFVELMPEGSFEYAVDLFVPVCVPPEEFDEWLEYGRRTSWAGLSQAARELVDSVLEKRSSKGNSAA